MSGNHTVVETERTRVPSAFRTRLTAFGFPQPHLSAFRFAPVFGFAQQSKMEIHSNELSAINDSVNLRQKYEARFWRPSRSVTLLGMELIDILRSNLQSLHQQMAQACARADRAPNTVQLVAVTKYAEWTWIEALRTLYQSDRSLGLARFGENRPQQLAERHVLMPDLEWHLIGQLQRNKVRLALQHSALIHSVDSVRLLERVAMVGQELRQIPRVLLQVNLSREEAKSGFDADTIRKGWNQVVAFSDRVHIHGLMTMAAESHDPEEARPVFRELCSLRDELQTTPESQAAQLTLSELSMGMSGDFIPAIEEGATLIRVGSRIFEGLT